MRHRLSALVLLGFLAFQPAEATQVRLLELEQLTERAARIFAGRCLHADTVFDDLVGAWVTVATFQVERAVKGVEGSTVTVRMVDAVFRPGEEVVLFLYGESALGLTAPVGLGQGRFQVVTDKLGQKRALNEIGNRTLRRVRPGTPRTGQDGAIDPAALLDTVQQLVGER